MIKDSGPLYRILKNSIQNDIAAGKYMPGDKLPSEMLITEKYNVSRVTVTRAFKELVNEGWIARTRGRGSFVREGIEDLIKEAAASLPASSANIPVGGYSGRNDTKCIGLTIIDIKGVFICNLISGIEETLRRKGWRLYIRVCTDAASEECAIRELREIGVKGIIVFPVDNEVYSEQLLKMKQERFPFVLIDRYLPGIDTNYAVVDNAEGGRLATEHLVLNGHSRIIVCARERPPLKTQSTMGRIDGYRQMLKESDIPHKESYIIDNIFDEKEGRSTEEWLEEFVRKEKITAAVALNAGIAIHLHQMFMKMGLRVPEDISIVSFDNPTPEYGHSSFFTYIKQPEYDVGCEAAKILLRAIELDGNGAAENAVFPVKLIEGSSVQRINR